MTVTDPHHTKTERILLALVVFQAAVLARLCSGHPARAPQYLGFAPGMPGTALAWGLASVVVIAYVWAAASLPDVRRYLLRPDRLKLIAVVAGLMAGVLEEVVFRKLVMDALHARGFGTAVQVAASALTFGAVHLVWGIRHLAAGINAALSTALLGAALALVYIAGDRSLAPCVVAHGLISALIEPGLMLAAVSDRLGWWRAKSPA